MTRKAYPSDVTDVEVASVDQGYTGDAPQNDAKVTRIELFVLSPRRLVMDCSFAWTSRFRRLARDFERKPESFSGFCWSNVTSVCQI